MKSFKKYITETYIGVDLNGTLAKYTHYRKGHIGAPIPKMLARVKKWIQEGKKVKIFTARANQPEEVAAIKQWLKKVGLPDLEITNVKDHMMSEIWDDRAVRVQKNTGEIESNPDVVEEGKMLNSLAALLLGTSALHPSTAEAKGHKHMIPHTPPAYHMQAEASELNQFANLIMKHEGLEAGQTPFRITSPEMRTWHKILGFPIAKTPAKSEGRNNFIYLENPSDVPKAIIAQFQSYASNPTKYGLSADATLGDAIKKFDQSGAHGKMEYLKNNMPNINFDQPLKDFMA